jgi:hypothetical protein
MCYSRWRWAPRRRAGKDAWRNPAPVRQPTTRRRRGGGQRARQTPTRPTGYIPPPHPRAGWGGGVCAWFSVDGVQARTYGPAQPRPRRQSISGPRPSRRMIGPDEEIAKRLNHVQRTTHKRTNTTDPRLCAAIVDRLTFGGTIIETGSDSYRLAHARALALRPR